jgi:hypothetical protein
MKKPIDAGERVRQQIRTLGYKQVVIAKKAGMAASKLSLFMNKYLDLGTDDLSRLSGVIADLETERARVATQLVAV